MEIKMPRQYALSLTPNEAYQLHRAVKIAESYDYEISEDLEEVISWLRAVANL